MKEILIANGFSYTGKCGSCGGTADKYAKRMGNRQALIKVKEHNKSFVLTYSGSVTKGYEHNLLAILERYGLLQAQSV